MSGGPGVSRDLRFSSRLVVPAALERSAEAAAKPAGPAEPPGPPPGNGPPPGGGPGFPEPADDDGDSPEGAGAIEQRWMERLRTTLANSPLRETTPLPLTFADDLRRKDVHEFLLDDRFHSEVPEPNGPIALPVSNPDEATRARAQKLADVTGLYVFTPDAKTLGKWEMLAPRPMHSRAGREVEFDAQTGAFHVSDADGVRRQIDPEAHLGGMAGYGGYKTAFHLGQLTVVVYRDLREVTEDEDEEPTAVDQPRDMMEKTKQVEALGAPYVAKIHGITHIYGNEALVMDTYSAATRSITGTTVLGDHSRQVYDVKLLTQRSVESLTAIKNWMIERKVRIPDIQFLIGRDGTFHLADFEDVIADSPPRANDLKAIDTYLALAQARVDRSA